MTETAITFIEIGVFLIALVFSIGVGLRLRENAKAHEEQAEKLDRKVRRAINI